MTKEKTKEIYDMAEKLGLKKENVEFGLKKDEELMTKSIKKAYKFKFGNK